MFVHVGHRTIAIACMECLVTGRKERGWGRGRVRRASRGKCQNLSVAGHGPAGMCRTCVRQIISDVRSSVRHRSLGGCRLSLLPVSSAIASRSNFVATYSRALPLATGTRGLERRRGRGILPVGSRGGVVHAWNASCALCEGADEREGNKAPALHILGWGGVGWGGVGWVCSARQLRIVVIVAPMLKDSLRSRRLATYTQLYLSRLTQLYLLCNQIGDTGDRCHCSRYTVIGRGALGTE